MKQTHPLVLAGILLVQAVLLMGAVVGGTGSSGGGGVSGWPTDSTTKEATWANSRANAICIGAGTNPLCIYEDLTLGGLIRPETDTNARTYVWPNFTWSLYDLASTKDMVIADPDAFSNGSGTITVQTSEQLVASNFGLEFSESDTNPTCAAGNYTIYADTSETKLKKCQNGTVSDLSSAGTSITDGIVVKASDEIVNNSTTLQDDNELIIPLDASSTYIFDGLITYNSATAADLQMDFTVPAGASGRRWLTYPQTTVTSCVTTTVTHNGGSITASATNIGATGANCDIPIRGIITTAGTSGNFVVQWAQNTADVSDSTVVAGSYLHWRKQ